MGFEYRVFYKPASAGELKRRDLSALAKSGAHYVPHESLKDASASDEKISFLPLHDDATLTLPTHDANGAVSVRVVASKDGNNPGLCDLSAPLVADDVKAAEAVLARAGFNVNTHKIKKSVLVTAEGPRVASKVGAGAKSIELEMHTMTVRVDKAKMGRGLAGSLTESWVTVVAKGAKKSAVADARRTLQESCQALAASGTFAECGYGKFVKDISARVTPAAPVQPASTEKAKAKEKIVATPPTSGKKRGRPPKASGPAAEKRAKGGDGGFGAAARGIAKSVQGAIRGIMLAAASPGPSGKLRADSDDDVPISRMVVKSPAKKRGRPPKAPPATSPPPSVVVVTAEDDDVPLSKLLPPKRKPGRPPGAKNKATKVAADAAAAGTPKRGRGRPPKATATPATTTPTPAKRGRGRPPGSANKAAAATPATTAGKNPRGRPPKTPAAVGPEDDDVPIGQLAAKVTSTQKKRGRPPKSAALAVVQTTPMKKKRGRPPKSATKPPPSVVVVTAEDDDVPLSKLLPPKKKPGRPPGAKNKATKVAAEAAAAGTPKRGRGRPPKAAATTTPATTTPTPAKRGRGRPPGSANKAAAATPATTAGKKPRGRPPKTPKTPAAVGPEDDDVPLGQLAAKVTSTQKKRGRPPGSKNKATGGGGEISESGAEGVDADGCDEAPRSAEAESPGGGERAVAGRGEAAARAAAGIRVEGGGEDADPVDGWKKTRTQAEGIVEGLECWWVRLIATPPGPGVRARTRRSRRARSV